MHFMNRDLNIRNEENNLFHGIKINSKINEIAYVCSPK